MHRLQLCQCRRALRRPAVPGPEGRRQRGLPQLTCEGNAVAFERILDVTATHTMRFFNRSASILSMCQPDIAETRMTTPDRQKWLQHTCDHAVLTDEGRCVVCDLPLVRRAASPRSPTGCQTAILPHQRRPLHLAMLCCLPLQPGLP